jgi:DHA1 family tetracycline resistance protein-like MFS transporter
LLLHRKQQVGRLFASLKGNARVIVVTEGVAAVSFQWYASYLPLYMLALGVSEAQVGVLAGALVLTKFVSTLLGGYFADRFGRKRILVTVDILCWGIPMLLYAVAQNPWYFVAGRLVNGFVYLVLPSFECLFVEDVPAERRAAVFGTLQFLTSGARLLAPVAGGLVAWLGIVRAGRLIMATCMVSSVTMAIIRHFTMQETTVGKERMSSTIAVPPKILIREYATTIAAMFRNDGVRTFLIVRSLVAFGTMMWTTYAVIYLTDTRGVALPQSAISLLPFISALVTMGMIVLSAERIQIKRVSDNLVLGQVLWLAAALFFVISPGGTIWFAIVWAVINALSTALFRPAERSYWANIVGDRERAQVFSASSAFMSMVTLLAGPLAGALYTLYPRGPFALGIALQILALGLVVSTRPRSIEAQAQSGQ